MAVFAFAADYEGRDVLNGFINNKCVGIEYTVRNKNSGNKDFS